MSERIIKTGGLAGLLAAVLFLALTVLTPVAAVGERQRLTGRLS